MRDHLLRITDSGRRNLLFHVPIEELYEMWSKCNKESNYKLGLLAMNHFYNFGRQISPIGSTKLLSLCMRCKQYDEAINLIKHSNAWLQEPPSLNLIYTLMDALFAKEEYAKVRLCFKYVRENWKLNIRPRLYDLTIKSCLLMPKYPLQEALIIYNDSRLMNVYLPESTHYTILKCTIDLYNNIQKDEDSMIYLDAMKLVKDRLERESMLASYKFSLFPQTLEILNIVSNILLQ